jgi:crotonobetainyl-CoA:carnitine CoA-transferase CaiB-like acyl-CoA transferase
MFQSSCGWEVEDGGEGNPPMWLRLGVCDHFAALASAYALLLGLYHRDRTGQGQMTDASLLGATILTTSEAVVRPDGRVEGLAHLDHGQTGLAPEHRLYECRDGWIAVAALSLAERAGFEAVAGAQPQARLRGLSTDEALAALGAAGAPAERVRREQLDAFLDDPDAWAAGLVSEVEHAIFGRMRQVGALWSLGDQRLGLDRPAPALGQHTREVLATLGVPAAEIEAMAADGVLVAQAEERR